ncbi:hypothetical protein [Kribbella deserti]|uniref:Uncharacterized protein n=1 Tax=Kribbella deserti TaxID=1926257 RepID=A0ABV6QU74_9ACTN
MSCEQPDKFAIWQDGQWRLNAGITQPGLPMVALLVPREHYRLDNLPPELLATLGPMLQRTTEAGAAYRQCRAVSLQSPG